MLERNLPPVAARVTLALMAGGFRARAGWYRLRRNEPAAAEMAGSLRGLAEGRRSDR
jgi:hypothetical protein